MKPKRHSEAQTAFALRHAESGTSVQGVTRKMAIPKATFYCWKEKYHGLGVAEVRRLMACSPYLAPAKTSHFAWIAWEGKGQAPSHPREWNASECP